MLSAHGDREYVRSRRLFLVGLAAVYLCAFASLLPQIRGLWGEHGVLPARDLIAFARDRFGATGIHALPTLAWIDASDATLLGFAWAGIAAALALALGVAPGWSALACWLFHLSLVSVGGEFLSFQWDALLLETGLLAIFVAPWRLGRARSEAERPLALARWLLWWLVARMMLESGLCKLASGDPHWRDLGALAFHYESQPLPNPLAYLAHHAPAWFHRASCLAMFAVELALPFAILVGRCGRQVAAAGFIALQLLIFATGNYGYFNLLTVVLALTLLDDASLGRIARVLRRTSKPPSARESVEAGFNKTRIVQMLALWIGWVSAVQVSDAVARAIGAPTLPAVLRKLEELGAPLRAVNRYGLFAVMTTTRREITIEGSLDGVEWRPYRLRWQIDDASAAPPFVAPHMPRLDWQMWFASLSSPDRQRWFPSLVAGLLDGSPTIEALFERVPFADEPPRTIRASIATYGFAPLGSPSWWQVGAPELYLPPVELDGEGGLRLAAGR